MRESRVIALAGVLQACRLVQRSRRCTASAERQQPCRPASPACSASTPTARPTSSVASPSVRLGLETLLAQFDGGPRDLALTRLVLSVLRLERRLSRSVRACCKRPAHRHRHDPAPGRSLRDLRTRPCRHASPSCMSTTLSHAAPARDRARQPGESGQRPASSSRSARCCSPRCAPRCCGARSAAASCACCFGGASTRCSRAACSRAARSIAASCERAWERRKPRCPSSCVRTSTAFLRSRLFLSVLPPFCVPKWIGNRAIVATRVAHAAARNP